MDQPVTTNPIIIMMINMTIVFAVLWGLSLIVRFIHIIDPTRKREDKNTPLDQKKNLSNLENGGKKEQAATNYEKTNRTDEETFILIAAAIAAYGYHPSEIVSIRPVGGKVWTQTARIEAVQSRNQMF